MTADEQSRLRALRVYHATALQVGDETQVANWAREIWKILGPVWTETGEVLVRAGVRKFRRPGKL
jgi:hypothetical protein